MRRSYAQDESWIATVHTRAELQPLCVGHVGLAAGYMLRIAGIHQQHGEAARFQNLENWDPVNAGGFTA